MNNLNNRFRFRMSKTFGITYTNFNYKYTIGTLLGHCIRETSYVNLKIKKCLCENYF